MPYPTEALRGSRATQHLQDVLGTRLCMIRHEGGAVSFQKVVQNEAPWFTIHSYSSGLRHSADPQRRRTRTKRRRRRGRRRRMMIMTMRCSWKARAVFGSLGFLLGASWGPRGGLLGVSWGSLGPSWGRPGGYLGRLGAIAQTPEESMILDSPGCLGWPREASWAVLGASWAVLKPSMIGVGLPKAVLGALLETACVVG